MEKCVVLRGTGLNLVPNANFVFNLIDCNYEEIILTYCFYYI